TSGAFRSCCHAANQNTVSRFRTLRSRPVIVPSKGNALFVADSQQLRAPVWIKAPSVPSFTFEDSPGMVKVHASLSMARSHDRFAVFWLLYTRADC
ncbi:MAG TPA: hypothetical protein VEC99_09615, partial [Clostridia bacterium]|nr:hypothetical protein [Clostridia bacterium]